MGVERQEGTQKHVGSRLTNADGEGHRGEPVHSEAVASAGSVDARGGAEQCQPVSVGEARKEAGSSDRRGGRDRRRESSRLEHTA